MTSRYDAGVSEEGLHRDDQPSRRPDVEDRSLGDLVSELTSDLSTLMRQELELAKAEMRREGKKAGAAAGMLGGAGVAGHLVLLFASLAVMWALGEVMHLGWAALIVTVVWVVVAAVLFTTGRKRMREVNPKPEQTTATLKEDLEWAKHPRS
jgi:uncharacterized membrane protein YqjE